MHIVFIIQKLLHILIHIFQEGLLAITGECLEKTRSKILFCKRHKHEVFHRYVFDGVSWANLAYQKFLNKLDKVTSFWF